MNASITSPIITYDLAKFADDQSTVTENDASVGWSNVGLSVICKREIF